MKTTNKPRKHRALVQWARSRELDLPLPYDSLIVQRRREVRLLQEQRRHHGTV